MEASVADNEDTESTNMDPESDYTNRPLDEVLGGLRDTVDDRDNFGLTVGELLYGMKMMSYIELFREANIGLDLFLQLNEEDLEILGIENKDDCKTLSNTIRNLQNKKNMAGVDPKSSLLCAEPEPKMSMRDVLLMQCYTGKQLKQIHKMLETIEDKLNKVELENTSFDSDYCAARALQLVCSEIAKQSDILLFELNSLNGALAQMPQQNQKNERDTCIPYFKNGSRVLSVISMLSLVSLTGIYLWKRLQR